MVSHGILFPMSKSIVAGIDVGTQMTRVIVCELGNSARPKILGFGSAPSRGMRHGHILNKNQAAQALQQALADAEKSTGVRVKEAYVAAGGITLGSHQVSKTIKLPEGAEITERHVTDAILSAESELLGRVQNVKVIDYSVQRYQVDTHTLRGKPIGMKSERLTVHTLFITMLQYHYDDLVEVITDAGIKIVDVIPSTVAASYAVLSPRQRVAGVLVADIGAETVSLAVFEDSNLRMLKVLPVGSSDITNDIALGFKIPLEDAEYAKLGQQRFTQEEVPAHQLSEIMYARVSEIFELIRKQLVLLRRDRLLPAGVVVTGGGSLLLSIEDYARETLSLPARIAQMPGNNSGQQRPNPSWLVAYGLCHAPLDETYIEKSHQGGGIGGYLGEAFSNVGGFFKNFLP